jgi:hypothetical protein
MMVGQFVSAFMLRQMEFGADRVAARIVGNAVFARGLEHTAMLAVACDQVRQELDTAWRERRLYDDIFSLMAQHERTLPQPVRASIQTALEERGGRWFDSHPHHRARIAAINREESADLFDIAGAPAALFADYPALARATTIHIYRTALGRAFSPQHLVSTPALMAQGVARRNAQDALQRFFNGLVSPLIPIFPSFSIVPRDDASAAEELLAARRQVRALAPGAQRALRQWVQADGEILRVVQAQTLLYCGVSANSIRPAQLQLTDFAGPCDHRQLRVHKHRMEFQQNTAQAKIKAALAAGIARINIAIGCARRVASEPLEDDRAEFAIADAPPANSTELILEALSSLHSAMPGLTALRREGHALLAALQLLKPQANSEALIGGVRQASRRVREQLVSLDKVLQETPYPYEHVNGKITLSRYALNGLPVPADIDIEGIKQAAASMLDACFSLYMRMMSDLSQQAEAFEAELGLDPLPEQVDSAATASALNQ